MRSRYLLVLVSVGVIAAGCGSGSRFSPVVPHKVQREIVKRFPTLAYMPTRLPAFPYGSHFSDYFSNTPTEIGLEFSGPQGPTDLSFLVGKVPRCVSGGGHVFRVNGILVRWVAKADGQQASRCIRRDHTAVWIGALRSVPGDDSLTTPQQRIDALLLVRMVAHIRYIG